MMYSCYCIYLSQCLKRWQMCTYVCVILMRLDVEKFQFGRWIHRLVRVWRDRQIYTSTSRNCVTFCPDVSKLPVIFRVAVIEFIFNDVIFIPHICIYTEYIFETTRKQQAYLGVFSKCLSISNVCVTAFLIRNPFHLQFTRSYFGMFKVLMCAHNFHRSLWTSHLR